MQWIRTNNPILYKTLKTSCKVSLRSWKFSGGSLDPQMESKCSNFFQFTWRNCRSENPNKADRGKFSSSQHFATRRPNGTISCKCFFVCGKSKMLSTSFSMFHDITTLMERLPGIGVERMDVINECHQATKVWLDEHESCRVASLKLYIHQFTVM